MHPRKPAPGFLTPNQWTWVDVSNVVEKGTEIYGIWRQALLCSIPLIRDYDVIKISIRDSQLNQSILNRNLGSGILKSAKLNINSNSRNFNDLKGLIDQQNGKSEFLLTLHGVEFDTTTWNRWSVWFDGYQ